MYPKLLKIQNHGGQQIFTLQIHEQFFNYIQKGIKSDFSIKLECRSCQRIAYIQSTDILRELMVRGANIIYPYTFLDSSNLIIYDPQSYGNLEKLEEHRLSCKTWL